MSDDVVEKARAIIRELLLSQRDQSQGGYAGFRKGQWDHWMVLKIDPATVPALFAFAEIVPDEIAPLGTCDTCAHSQNGVERGYKRPCTNCQRPRMSQWQAKHHFNQQLIDNVEKLRARLSVGHVCLHSTVGPDLIFLSIRDVDGPRRRGPYFRCRQCGVEHDVPFTFDQLREEALP